jgi:hypothetical protein
VSCINVSESVVYSKFLDRDILVITTDTAESTSISTP